MCSFHQVKQDQLPEKVLDWLQEPQSAIQLEIYLNWYIINLLEPVKILVELSKRGLTLELKYSFGALLSQNHHWMPQ